MRKHRGIGGMKNITEKVIKMHKTNENLKYIDDCKSIILIILTLIMQLTMSHQSPHFASNLQRSQPLSNQNYPKQHYEYSSETSAGSDEHHLVENLDKSKVKTSLCKNYTRDSFCPYGNKCQFAHGVGELKCNNPENIHYKTKVCVSFLKNLYCVYGPRCNYIHGLPRASTNWKKIYMNCGQVIREERAERRMREENQSRLLLILREGYNEEKRFRKHSMNYITCGASSNPLNV